MASSCVNLWCMVASTRHIVNVQGQPQSANSLTCLDKKRIITSERGTVSGTMEPVEFKKLEAKTTQLLKVCEDLTAEKHKSVEQLKLRELEVKELRHRLALFEREKGLIKEKVEGLITRLDGLIQSA